MPAKDIMGQLKLGGNILTVLAYVLSKNLRIEGVTMATISFSRRTPFVPVLELEHRQRVSTLLPWSA